MHVAIIGGGVAGVTAARTIRENNPEAEISIFTNKNHLYYLRPRLYEVLFGEDKPKEICMLRARKNYKFQAIIFEEVSPKGDVEPKKL